MYNRIRNKQFEFFFQITHIFQNYGKGVRYVWFYHYGQDLMFWKGHFGSKMTGCSITLDLPTKNSFLN